MLQDSQNMQISPIAAFSDNYIWLIHQPGESTAMVVDPGDATPVLAELQRRNLSLGGILITHHHPDHVGGVTRLLADTPVPVYGPTNSPASCITHPRREGDSLFYAGVEFRVLEVPGHTLDHIAYYATPDQSDPALFCGDTLFAGGCGRLFEGTAPQMHQSLGKLTALPPETAVYCAHEYTLANLNFARAVEPDSHALQERIAREQQRRATQQPTVPSSIAVELATNPFLRSEQAAVAAATVAHCGREMTEPAEIFAALRQWKDHF